jgi:prepilin-type N-terminal cleavage/methylation domain-containing protein
MLGNKGLTVIELLMVLSIVCLLAICVSGGMGG